MPKGQVILNKRKLKSYHYAGFWVRAVAALIDFIIVVFLEGMIEKLFFPSSLSVKINGNSGYGVIAPAALWNSIQSGSCEVYFYDSVSSGGLFFLTAIIYYAAQQSSRFQATLGMRALGLQMIDEEGQRISFIWAAIRYVASLFSAMILGIGYLMIAFTPRKQALHDLISSVYVIRKI